MKEIRRLISVAGIAAFFIVFYFLCSKFAQDTRNMSPEEMGINDAGLTSAENASFELMLKNHIEANYSADINISAVGDLMVYDYQLEYAQKGTGFDFTDSFKYVKGHIPRNYAPTSYEKVEN